MKKILKISIFTIALTALAGCSQTQNTPHSNYRNITPQRGKVVINQSYAYKFSEVGRDIYKNSGTEESEVFRTGRYTLSIGNPIGGQKYLLRQIVNVNLNSPKKRSIQARTVKDGLIAVLNGTGYSLCTNYKPVLGQLFNKPLPKVHYEITNLHLDDALQMLVGSPFQLIADEKARVVCFDEK